MNLILGEISATEHQDQKYTKYWSFQKVSLMEIKLGQWDQTGKNYELRRWTFYDK